MTTSPDPSMTTTGSSAAPYPRLCGQCGAPEHGSAACGTMPAPAPSTDLASEEPKCPHCGEPYDSDNTCNDYRLHHMPLTPCRDTDSACWRAQQEAFLRYPEHDPAGRSDFLAGALWQRGGYEFGFHKGESR